MPYLRNIKTKNQKEKYKVDTQIALKAGYPYSQVPYCGVQVYMIT